MFKGIISFSVAVFLGVQLFLVAQQEVKSKESNIASATPVVWVHHSLDWWNWWWRDNCSNKRIYPKFGFLSTLAFKYNGQVYEDAMKEVTKVTTQARKAGYKVIPTFLVHMNKDYEKGKEFDSWFDRKAWSERAKWLEGMIPLAHNNTLGVDIEPYWKNEDAQRYPGEKDGEKMAKAIKPFVDVAIKNNIQLYVFPEEDVWARVASKMGADIAALHEDSYSLPDYYESDKKAYIDLLKKMKKRQIRDEAAGLRYIPGFYETAFKKLGFLEAMAELGYKEVWVFVRRAKPEVYNYNKFCLPEFYDLEPYNFK